MAEFLTRPEQKNYTPLLPLQARLMIYVNKNDSSFLDPKNRFERGQVEAASPLVSIDVLDQTFTIIENASIRERKATAGVSKNEIDEAINTWAEKNAKVINKKKGVDLFRKIFGVKAEKVSTENMINFYEKYFQGGNGKQSVQLFVHDVVGYYTSDMRIDVDGLKRDIDAIQSLAGAFGSTTSEIIAQLVDAEIEFMKNTLSNSDKLSQEIDNISAGDDNERLLQFLIEGEHLDAPKQIPTTEPPKTEPPKTEPPKTEPPKTETPTSIPSPAATNEIPAWAKSITTSETDQALLEKDRIYPLEEMFEMVEGPVDPTHKYFVENPPDEITLTDELMEDLQIINRPFFVNIKKIGETGQVNYGVNEKIVPFLFKIGDGATPPDKPDQRFLNGEAATDGDSGLFALAAASAKTPAEQARLYKSLAKAVISIHQEHPTLLNLWVNMQDKIEDGNDYSSLDMFFNNDAQRRKQNDFRMNEILLPLKDDGGINFDLWETRIMNLSEKLKGGTLQLADLRQIEFLAHSVDVTKLVEMSKTKREIENEPEQVQLKGPELYKGYLEALAKYRKADDAAYDYFWGKKINQDADPLNHPVYGPLAYDVMLTRKAFEKFADKLEDELLPSLLGIEPFSGDSLDSNLPLYLLKKQIISYSIQISDPKNDKYREEFNKGIQTKLNELIEYMRKKTGQKVNYEKAEELMAAHDKFIKAKIQS